MSPLVVNRRDAAPTSLDQVQRLFSMFPTAGPGLGLVLLRLSVAATVVGLTVTPWLSIPLAALIAVGLGTPILALGAAALHACRLVMMTSTESTPWDDVALAAALALLGPGAYSLDATRFGRRVVVDVDSASTKE